MKKYTFTFNTEAKKNLTHEEVSDLGLKNVLNYFLTKGSPLATITNIKIEDIKPQKLDSNLIDFLNHYTKEIDYLFSDHCFNTNEQKIKLKSLEDVLRFVYNWTLTDIRNYASDYINKNITRDKIV